MKQYLNMSGYFIGSVTINADGQICDDKHFRGSTDIAEDYYGPICHAINSHDELVQMNQELLAALGDAAASLETIQLRSFGEDSFLDSKPEMRSYAGSRASVARAAIAKAKRGEA